MVVACIRLLLLWSLAFPAWAGVTTCAPPPDEIALWEPAIRLANMEVAPASVAHVRLVVEGDKVRVVVRGSPNSDVMDRPTSEAERESVAQVAASLAEPDLEASFVGPPAPDPTPAAPPVKSAPKRVAKKPVRRRRARATPTPKPVVAPEPKREPIEMPTVEETGPNIVEVALARPSEVLFTSSRFDPTGFDGLVNGPRVRLDLTAGTGVALRPRVMGGAFRVTAGGGVTIQHGVRAAVAAGIEAPAPYIYPEGHVGPPTTGTWGFDVMGGLGVSPTWKVVVEPMLFGGATYRVFVGAGSIWRPLMVGQLSVLSRPKPAGQFGVRTSLRGELLQTNPFLGGTGHRTAWSEFSVEVAIIARFVRFVDGGAKKNSSRVIR